jgi:protein-S-isoprenylcysteine O-methyltransferase Ste14
VFERQGIHLAALGLLLVAVALVRGEATAAGAWGGLSSDAWLWIGVAVAASHQVYIALVWRAELHHRVFSRLAGWRVAFLVFASDFVLLALARVVVLLILAAANRGVWDLPRGLVVALSLLAGVPFVALLVDITRHLTWPRAIGRDHFDPTLERHLVREGLFGLIENPIYSIGPLPLYLPGLWMGSPAALLLAAFQHAYLWVHWVATEQPDLERIYGGDRE